MNNYGYICEYYKQIQSGSVTVGKWILKLYEQIIDGLDNGKFFYDAKKARRAVKFIETLVHHHEGALAPGLLKLELWQKALVSMIFGIVDKDGNRQFREVFFVVARKNGKTLLAAAIAEYMAFLDGEYGGRIYFAAPKLEQANLCFDAFYQSILNEPEISEMAQKRRTDIYISDNNTSARPLAFSAKKSDGLNVSLAVLDEVAAWEGDAGLKFYEVIKSSVGARKQPLILAMSTAGYVNDGVYDELMRRSTRVLLGDSKEKRLLPVLYTIDDVGRWNDIEELRKSNPMLGISVTEEYLEEEIAIAEGSLPKKAEFITKYCNIRQNSSQAWLESNVIETAGGPPLHIEDFRGCYCVGGVDLSRTTDLTAAICVVEKNGELYVFAKFWLPEERIELLQDIDGVPYNIYLQRGLLSVSGQNIIDYHDVYQWFRDLVEKYGMYPLKVGYDKYSAAYLVQDMKAYGFHMDDVVQGFNLDPVITEAEGLLKDGKIHIGDNDLLKIHMYNSALKTNVEKGRRKLVKMKSTAHIDGMAALLDALTVRQKWYSEIGQQLKNGG